MNFNNARSKYMRKIAKTYWRTRILLH